MAITCTLKLYITQISEDKNMIVEPIYGYLYGLSLDSSKFKTIDDFQFIKPSLDMSIKLNSSQMGILPYSNFKYNYLEVFPKNQDTDGKTIYFFITDIRWVAQSTISLTLRMDVLNTFACTWTDTDVLSKQTKINRLTLKKYTKDTYHNQVDFNIPFLCDEIFPVKYLKNKWTLEDLEYPTGAKWYLIYKSRISSEDLENRPVDCFISTDSVSIKIRTKTNPDLVYSNISYDYLWILASENQNNASITFIDKDGRERTINVNGNQTRAILIQKIASGGDNYFKIGCYTYSKDAFGMYEIQWSSPFNTLEWRTAGATGDENKIKCNNVSRIRQGSGVVKYFHTDIVALTYVDPNETTTDYLLNDISTLDRTDTTLIKVIELPYCPISMTNVATLTYTTTEGFFDITMGMIRLYDTSKKLSNTIVNSPTGASNIASQFHQSITSFSSSYPNNTVMTDSLWQDFALEPMLKHSNYSSYKYVYDTFEKEFSLEELEYDQTYEYVQLFNIKFIMTTTINSRFMFDLSNNGYTYKVNGLLYPNYMFIQRNNELPLYSNAFINYIRTGYNYDQKNRYLALGQNALNLGIDTIENVGNAFSQGTEAGLISGLVKTGVGLVKGISSMAFDNVKTLLSIEQKQLSAKYQGTSFTGADDLDLMDTYAGNKLCFAIFIPSPIMIKALHQMYYYNGYPVNYYDNKLPHSNRYWFDFVQAELVFNKTKVDNISKECQIELIQKYAEGVTYYHIRNGEYDFDQKYVNHDDGLL